MRVYEREIVVCVILSLWFIEFSSFFILNMYFTNKKLIFLKEKGFTKSQMSKTRVKVSDSMTVEGF